MILPRRELRQALEGKGDGLRSDDGLASRSQPFHVAAQDRRAIDVLRVDGESRFRPLFAAEKDQEAAVPPRQSLGDAHLELHAGGSGVARSSHPERIKDKETRRPGDDERRRDLVRPRFPALASASKDIRFSLSPEFYPFFRAKSFMNDARTWHISGLTAL